MDITCQVRSKAPPVPAAFPEIAFSVGCATSCCQNQEKGEIGCRVVEDPWRVTHDDA